MLYTKKQQLYILILHAYNAIYQEITTLYINITRLSCYIPKKQQLYVLILHAYNAITITLAVSSRK